MKAQHLQKIKVNFNEAEITLQSLKKKGVNIVFTNGVFDILHSGHVQYLAEAKQEGQFLIVGVNSDLSVNKLKGEKRPILSLEERMIILSSLEFVDMLIPFNEDTPLNLIVQIKPDVLVKGGDYTIETIVGAKEVMEEGGIVKVLTFKDDYSTTNIIETILNKYGNG